MPFRLQYAAGVGVSTLTVNATSHLSGAELIHRLAEAPGHTSAPVATPRHGGPGLVANTSLEGTYSEIYPHIRRDEDGLLRQFSFPDGIPGHVAPQTPGSIHECGELGDAPAHTYGAAFDHPDLLVCCVVGDGEAESGRLRRAGTRTSSSTPPATARCCRSCTSRTTRSPTPPFWTRIPERELRSLQEGDGYARFVEGSKPEAMHQLMAATPDQVADEIASGWSPGRT
jgi:xylulose-5-phosphate/fructose-6-phosphate phosphoketolase